MNPLHRHKGKVDFKKVIHTIFLIIIGFSVVIALLWYYQDNKKKKEALSPSPTTTTLYDETANWYKLKNSEYGFEIKYLGDILTKQEYSADFNQYLSRSMDATKLISTSRVDLIGNQQCYYGQSGIATVCDVAKEGGILIVPMSVDDMKKIMVELDKNLLATETVIKGKKAFKYEMGVEGEGEESYYIQIDNDKALLISRIYVDTFKPDPEFFEKILNTMTFTK